MDGNFLKITKAIVNEPQLLIDYNSKIKSLIESPQFSYFVSGVAACINENIKFLFVDNIPLTRFKDLDRAINQNIESISLDREDFEKIILAVILEYSHYSKLKIVKGMSVDKFKIFISDIISNVKFSMEDSNYDMLSEIYINQLLISITNDPNFNKAHFEQFYSENMVGFYKSTNCGFSSRDFASDNLKKIKQRLTKKKFTYDTIKMLVIYNTRLQLDTFFSNDEYLSHLCDTLSELGEQLYHLEARTSVNDSYLIYKRLISSKNKLNLRKIVFSHFNKRIAKHGEFLKKIKAKNIYDCVGRDTIKTLSYLKKSNIPIKEIVFNQMIESNKEAYDLLMNEAPNIFYYSFAKIGFRGFNQMQLLKEELKHPTGCDIEDEYASKSDFLYPFSNAGWKFFIKQNKNYILRSSRDDRIASICANNQLQDAWLRTPQLRALTCKSNIYISCIKLIEKSIREHSGAVSDYTGFKSHLIYNPSKRATKFNFNILSDFSKGFTDSFNTLKETVDKLDTYLTNDITIPPSENRILHLNIRRAKLHFSLIDSCVSICRYKIHESIFSKDPTFLKRHLKFWEFYDEVARMTDNKFRSNNLVDSNTVFREQHFSFSRVALNEDHIMQNRCFLELIEKNIGRIKRFYSESLYLIYRDNNFDYFHSLLSEYFAVKKYQLHERGEDNLFINNVYVRQSHAIDKIDDFISQNYCAPFRLENANESSCKILMRVKDRYIKNIKDLDHLYRISEEWHDRLGDDGKINERELENIQFPFDFIKMLPSYSRKNNMFTYENFYISPILDTIHLYREKIQMKHCIFGFHQRCVDKNYIAFRVESFLDDSAHRRATLGCTISKIDNTVISIAFNQSYGVRDSTLSSSQISSMKVFIKNINSELELIRKLPDYNTSELLS